MGTSPDMIMPIVLGALLVAFAIAAPPDRVHLGIILLKGIDSGASTRAALLDFVGNYDGQGIARRYRWVADGELRNPSIWIYQVP